MEPFVDLWYDIFVMIRTDQILTHFEDLVMKKINKDGMNMREKKYNHFIRNISIILLGCVFIYFILGEIFLPTDNLGEMGSAEKYAGEWMRIMPNGNRIPQEVPGRCNAERNEIVTIETKLPDQIPEDSYLCFRSAKQDMEIYVDGELRQTYSTKDTRLVGKVSAAAYIFLQLRVEDEGKGLQLRTRTDSSYSGIFYSVYVGNRMEIWRVLIKQYGVELVIAFVVLILSIISIVGGLLIRVLYHRMLSFDYLAWGVFMASMWLITNSVLRQLIFPNLSVINDIAFCIIMLLPIPFLLYMNVIQKRRYRKGHQIAVVVAMLNFFVCTILHVTHVRDFTDTIQYMAIISLLAILYMVATIMVDIHRGYIKEYTYVAVGIFLALLAAAFQIFSYFRRTSLFSGVFLSIGLMFLLIFAVLNTAREILAMERQKQQALSASEAKGLFLANMSHEIRTPINAVLGMDAMILRESTEESVREYAMDIQKAGQILLSLINDVLDLTKIESGKMEILVVEYDLSSLIHDVHNMISMKVEGKDLSIQLQVDENLPSKLYGDDIRLRQILVNLLNNAIKYTEKGTVTLSVSGKRIENGIRLCFEVTDTGIGIKEQDMNRLFQMFERIEESRNRNVEGSGLGMSIVVRLLQLMGSKLQVESVYGEGSTFSFEVDQEIAEEDPIGNLEERLRNHVNKYSYQVSFVAPEAELLVVDDNAINRKVFINLLKETKTHIDEASSGWECLDKVSEKHYDIIFLDDMMPEISGIETLGRLQKLENSFCKDTPVIALTANAVAGAREMYLSEGFRDYLTKPIRPETLESMILAYMPKEKISQESNVTEMIEDSNSELPDVEGIDWKYALLHTKDVGMLKDTVYTFYTIAIGERRTLESFRQLLMESEPKTQEWIDACCQYRIKVHAMKSSAALIGAISLSSLAKLLEYAARDENADVIERLHPVFIDEWKKLEKNLSVMFPEEVVEKIPPDYPLILEYLDQLKDAMTVMDIDTADDLSAKLDAYDYPDNMILAIEMLTMGVRNLDTEGVTKYAEQLATKIQQRGE